MKSDVDKITIRMDSVCENLNKTEFDDSEKELVMSAVEEVNSVLEYLRELKAYRATGYTPEQVQELHNKHWNECRQIALYDDENRKLRRLLKLALEELTVPCDFCAYRHCPPSPERIGCTWRHAAEARTLIGGDAL